MTSAKSIKDLQALIFDGYATNRLTGSFILIERAPTRRRCRHVFRHGNRETEYNDFAIEEDPSMANQGIVYLVGAGPGDTGLFTVRGVELLARAEVVIYDGLVNANCFASRRPRRNHLRRQT